MTTIARVSNIKKNMLDCKPEETGIIILGDAGLNFYLNGTDKKYKKQLNNMGYYIYCVRGNHEERPENIPGMVLVEDTETDNTVWIEEEYPNIRYFVDFFAATVCRRKVEVCVVEHGEHALEITHNVPAKGKQSFFRFA